MDVMITVWASSGRVCVRRDGDRYAARVRVDQLARVLGEMGVGGEQRMGGGVYPEVAPGARCCAAARRAPLSAA